MNKYIFKLLGLSISIILLSNFFYIYSAKAATSLNIEVVQPCNVNYGGDSCVAEVKLTNNTGEILDGTAFLHIDYRGICSSDELANFDGEGITAQFSNNNNWLDFSGWEEGTTIVSGFDIIKNESQSKLKIETVSNLCPGNYTFTLTLEGNTESGETYTAEAIIGGGGGNYTPSAPGEDRITSFTNPDGSKIELTIPGGAVSEDTKFTIERVDINSINQPSSESGLFLINGLVYEIKAEVNGEFITTFDKPLILTFTYTEEQIEGFDEDSLKIYWWDGENWVVFGNSEVDGENNTVTASIDHFTLFALMGSEIEFIGEEEEEEEPFNEAQGEEEEEEEEILSEGETEEVIGEEEEEEEEEEEKTPEEGVPAGGLLAAIGAIPFNQKVALGILVIVIIALVALWFTKKRKAKA